MTLRNGYDTELRFQPGEKELRIMHDRPLLLVEGVEMNAFHFAEALCEGLGVTPEELTRWSKDDRDPWKQRHARILTSLLRCAPAMMTDPEVLAHLRGHVEAHLEADRKDF